MTTEALIRKKFRALEGSMDERVTRLWAGAEAEAMGRGGLAAVSRATGLAISTVQKGRNELRAGAKADGLVKVRREGGGRRKHEEVHPELLTHLQKLVDPATRGDPESPLRWTAKSAVVLAQQMFDGYGIRVSDKTVGRLLHQLGYSLQATKKTVEGAQHPDRNVQFEHINEQATECIKRGVPFISVDAKKKELVGNFKNAGVDVGTDHDTPVFAVTSIEAWWKRMGMKRYPDAQELFITADAGAATDTARGSGRSSCSASPTRPDSRSM